MCVSPRSPAPAGLFVCLAVLAGCGNESTDASAQWQEEQMTDYSFVLDSRCGERDMLGRFEIEVRDGEVVDATGLDEPATRWIAQRDVADLPSIDDLLDEVARAQAEGAEVVDVEFAESDGHPTVISIDWLVNAEDDEVCYEVIDVRPADLVITGDGPATSYDGPLDVPDDARNTGYRLDDWELWTVPDETTVYIRTPAGVEAWPAVKEGMGCM